MRRAVLPICYLAALVACAPFPELEAMGPDTARSPQLLPIDELLSQSGGTTLDPGPGLAARAAGLKARAAAISAAPSAP